MPCGCSGGSQTEWVFTAPDGSKKVYTKQIEAQVAKIRAGGGTIESRPK